MIRLLDLLFTLCNACAAVYQQDPANNSRHVARIVSFHLRSMQIRRTAVLASRAPATYLAHLVLLCHHYSFCSTPRDNDVMFAQRLNPTTGQLEWAVVGLANDASSNGDPLMATTSYTDMLNDDARNRAYRRALEAAVQPDDLVLDIGTGTGLLAMMAARSMRHANSTGSVVGCEVHPATANLARRIVAANGLADTVCIVGKRSNDLIVGQGA